MKALRGPAAWRAVSVAACLLLCTAALPAAVLADQALRYVNDAVITLGDVAQRNQMRIQDHQRRGLVVPGDRAELIAFSRRTLEDLTDEVLLSQEATKLGMGGNHDDVVRAVLEASKRAGNALTLRDQAETRRMLERNRLVDMVLGYYEGHSPMPTPASLQQLYDQRRGEFARPPRARVLQIVLHPSAPELRQELRNARAALLRKAQADPDPAASAVAARHLDDYLQQSAPAGQEAVLGRLVAELAALAGADGAPASAREAAAILARQASLRTPEQARAALEAVRLALAGRWGRDLEQGFRDEARRLSQGPNADQGGQLGWVEPGAYSKAFDEVVFNCRPGTMTGVFAAGPAACLALVAERTEARIRSFDEVSGELDVSERRRRREELRRTLVGILRTQAMIRDVAALDGTL